MAEGPMMLTKEQVNEKSKEVQEMYQQLVQRAQQKVSQWKQKDVAVNVDPWKYAQAQNRITFEDIISDPKFAKELFSSAGLQNDETYNKFISDLQTLSNYMDELDTNLQTMINEFSDEFEGGQQNIPTPPPETPTTSVQELLTFHTAPTDATATPEATSSYEKVLIKQKNEQKEVKEILLPLKKSAEKINELQQEYGATSDFSERGKLLDKMEKEINHYQQELIKVKDKLRDKFNISNEFDDSIVVEKIKEFTGDSQLVNEYLNIASNRETFENTYLSKRFGMINEKLNELRGAIKTNASEKVKRKLAEETLQQYWKTGQFVLGSEYNPKVRSWIEKSYKNIENGEDLLSNKEDLEMLNKKWEEIQMGETISALGYTSHFVGNVATDFTRTVSGDGLGSSVEYNIGNLVSLSEEMDRNIKLAKNRLTKYEESYTHLITTYNKFIDGKITKEQFQDAKSEFLSQREKVVSLGKKIKGDLFMLSRNMDDEEYSRWKQGFLENKDVNYVISVLNIERNDEIAHAMKAYKVTGFLDDPKLAVGLSLIPKVGVEVSTVLVGVSGMTQADIVAAYPELQVVEGKTPNEIMFNTGTDMALTAGIGNVAKRIDEGKIVREGIKKAGKVFPKVFRDEFASEILPTATAKGVASYSEELLTETSLGGAIPGNVKKELHFDVGMEFSEKYSSVLHGEEIGDLNEIVNVTVFWEENPSYISKSDASLMLDLYSGKQGLEGTYDWGK